jgi:hypothetical protein
VQVLSVSVPTNTREPFHTHEAFSFMCINMGGDSGDGQTYFNEHNQIVFNDKPHKPNQSADIHVQWMVPEWFHSIQNTGPLKAKIGSGYQLSSGGYHALRVMFLGSQPLVQPTPPPAKPTPPPAPAPSRCGQSCSTDADCPSNSSCPHCENLILGQCVVG